MEPIRPDRVTGRRNSDRDPSDDGLPWSHAPRLPLMTSDTISTEVRRTIDALTVDRVDDPVELLFVGERSVWLVVDPDRIESEDAMIDVFHALESIPEVDTLYVARTDLRASDHDRGC